MLSDDVIIKGLEILSLFKLESLFGFTPLPLYDLMMGDFDFYMRDLFSKTFSSRYLNRDIIKFKFCINYEKCLL